MEERIIDDEYGRGIRLKKTEEGYVDATDELAEERIETDDGEEVLADEIAFEFPELEEDDEDLVNLSPQEALELRKKKAEEEAARKEEYERLCTDGETLLSSGSFKAAELKFEKALLLDEEAAEASYGYWRAKTADFAESEVLIDEYADVGFEELESDLGYQAVQLIRENYGESFKQKVKELEKREAPLAEEVLEKQSARREVLKERRKKAMIAFFVSLVPTLVALVLTIVFGAQIFSTPDGKFVTYTIIAGACLLVTLIVLLVLTNKLLNAVRMYNKNERLSSTEEGAELVKIRRSKKLYEQLCR